MASPQRQATARHRSTEKLDDLSASLTTHKLGPKDEIRDLRANRDEHTSILDLGEERSQCINAAAMKQPGLTQPSSFLHGTDPFLQGECVLIGFPRPLNIKDADSSPGSRLLSFAPGGSSHQQFAFIRSSVLRDDASYDVDWYPVVSFTNQGGGLSGYNALPADVRACLIPLPGPSLSSGHLTPITFGNAIFLSGFLFSKDSFLLVKPHRFIVPEDKTFRRWDPPIRLSHRQLHQIDDYRNAILNQPAATNDGNRASSFRGKGRGRGKKEKVFRTNSRPRASSQGEGDRQGWGAGLENDRKNQESYRNNSRSARISQGNVAYGAGSNTLTLSFEELQYLVTEDVDDDPRGANATFKDDLMLLAGPSDDGTWRRELDKFLQAEKKEVQEQSVARVHDWLHRNTKI